MAAIRLSNEVTTRMRECRYVLSAFFAEGAELVANLLLGMTQRNLGEDEEPPGFAGVIYALGKSLRAALDRMVYADLALYAALTFEADLRKLRDLKIEDLGFQLVGMRRTIIGQYVAPDLEGLGLQPVDARDTMTVTRRVELLDDRFQAPNLDRLLGKARFDEPQNPRVLVSQMKATNTEVDGLVEQINEAKRKIEWARAKKQEADATSPIGSGSRPVPAAPRRTTEVSPEIPPSTRKASSRRWIRPRRVSPPTVRRR